MLAAVRPYRSRTSLCYREISASAHQASSGRTAFDCLDRASLPGELQRFLQPRESLRRCGFEPRTQLRVTVAFPCPYLRGSVRFTLIRRYHPLATV
jgi:hypothetical protein